MLKANEYEKTYREYVAENLRLIGENTAAKVNGSYIKKRYSEIINPPPEETRTPEEVIEHMKNKLHGLSGGGGTPDGFV